ncbi:alkaline phosphatase family protein [Microbacterium rhizophilus]|uniref:alkaline phosphatase family protein n=1 Tax=Microbacterium rhizophilus TaxID=3138934 RepID=UPI0031EEF3B2
MRRFLLIALDGVRHDRLLTTRTPRIDEVVASGFLTTAVIPATQPTMSAAQWATILTGVWSAEHGVRRNWQRTPRLHRHPDLLERVRRAGGETYAAASWPVIGRRTGAGPLVRGDVFVPLRRPTTLTSWVRADEAVTAHAEVALRARDLAAAFVYLGQVDMAGHFHGVGERYVAALEATDALVGRLLAAISDRRDEWTVLLTTDHGHRDEGGHGTHTSPEATVWFAGDRRIAGWDALDSTRVVDFALRALAGA